MFAFHQLISTTHHTTLHLLDPFFNKTLSSPLSSSHNWEVSFWHLFLMFECYITCTWSSSCKLQYKLLYLWPSIFCSWGWVHPFRSLSIRDNVSENITLCVCCWFRKWHTSRKHHTNQFMFWFWKNAVNYRCKVPALYCCHGGSMGLFTFMVLAVV